MASNPASKTDEAAEGRLKVRPAVRLPNLRRVRALLIFVVAAIIVATSLPTTILFIVGMVPTLVAFIVDLTPGRYACRCIAGLNFAGVVPFVDRLWSGPNTIDWAVRVLSDPVSWFSFYGSAAIGLMLFMSLPNAVAAMQVLNGARQVQVLRNRQKELAHEWDIGNADNASANSDKDDEDDDKDRDPSAMADEDGIEDDDAEDTESATAS